MPLSFFNPSLSILACLPCPVLQRDEHQTFLTVKEVLTFAHESCAAPVPEGASAAVATDRAERVARVIEAFGLKECENTIMGNAIGALAWGSDTASAHLAPMPNLLKLADSWTQRLLSWPHRLAVQFDN